MKVIVYLIFVLLMALTIWLTMFGLFTPGVREVRQACAKHQGVQSIAEPALPFEGTIIVCRDGKVELP